MIIENIKHTRSHRRFTEKKINEDEILKMLEGARFSASTKNAQILRYSYTIDDEKCKKLFSSVSLGGLLKNEDKATLEEAVNNIKTNTRHYAKRQLTWFKRYDNAHWIEIQKGQMVGNVVDEILEASK